MFIRLNHITSDHVAGKSLFERYSNYAKSNRNARIDYKDHSNIEDEDMQNITTGTVTSGNTRYGIIHPWNPWSRPFDNDDNNSISWPQTMKKVMEMSTISNRIKVDVIDNKDSYIVIADLPGYSEESIQIYMDEEGSLNITAERIVEADRTDENTTFVLQERNSERIQRSISISGHINLENAQAEYKDGVLTILLPKDQTEKNRYISIKKPAKSS